jgi:hypothetical protein
MGFLELDVDDIRRVVESWAPGPECFSEARYRESLLKHLKEAFPKKRFHAEFKMGNGRADIFVDFEDWTGFGAKVLIELKCNLTTQNACNRLIGQLAHYVNFGEVIVVLCGETKPAFVAVVTKSLAAFRDQKGSLKGHVLQKPFAARAKSGRFTSGKAA